MPTTEAVQDRDPSAFTRIAADRYRRVEVNLLGRFMRQNRQEHQCRVLDISVGGANLQGPLTVDVGETIVVYFDEIGRLEGTVTRRMPDGFAIEFRVTPRKREKLAEQLTWLINRNILDLPDARRHERVIPTTRETTLQLLNGRSAPCVLEDVSVSGASVRTSARPDIGSEVVIGRLRGIVRRHHSTGIGIEFMNIQSQDALDRHFD